MIQGIAGAGIGVLVGLLARPFFDAYIATRLSRDAAVVEIIDDAADRVTLS